MIEIPDLLHKIIDLVSSHNLSFIDASIKLCRDEDYEVEYVATMIRKHPVLMSKIRDEAIELKMVKPDGKSLPI